MRACVCKRESVYYLFMAVIRIRSLLPNEVVIAKGICAIVAGTLARRSAKNASRNYASKKYVQNANVNVKGICRVMTVVSPWFLGEVLVVVA